MEHIVVIRERPKRSIQIWEVITILLAKKKSSRVDFVFSNAHIIVEKKMKTKLKTTKIKSKTNLVCRYQNEHVLPFFVWKQSLPGCG
jgi:hypothetical protein